MFPTNTCVVDQVEYGTFGYEGCLIEGTEGIKCLKWTGICPHSHFLDWKSQSNNGKATGIWAKSRLGFARVKFGLGNGIYNLP